MLFSKNNPLNSLLPTLLCLFLCLSPVLAEEPSEYLINNGKSKLKKQSGDVVYLSRDSLIECKKLVEHGQVKNISSCVWGKIKNSYTDEYNKWSEAGSILYLHVGKPAANSIAEGAADLGNSGWETVSGSAGTLKIKYQEDVSPWMQQKWNSTLSTGATSWSKAKEMTGRAKIAITETYSNSVIPALGTAKDATFNAAESAKEKIAQTYSDSVSPALAKAKDTTVNSAISAKEKAVDTYNNSVAPTLGTAKDATFNAAAAAKEKIAQTYSDTVSPALSNAKDKTIEAAKSAGKTAGKAYDSTKETLKNYWSSWTGR